MPVIMMSGHGTIDTAVEATKVGATAFLEKPITLQKLLRAVEQALAKPGPGKGAPAVPARNLRTDLMGGDSDWMPPTNHAAVLLPVVPEGPRSEQSFDLDRPLREARDAFEKSYFEFHLAKEGGSMTRVAEKTGLERTQPLPQAQAAGRGPCHATSAAQPEAASVGPGDERLYLRALFRAKPQEVREQGLVAQLVEQRIENPRVGGSIPPQATKHS